MVDRYKLSQEILALADTTPMNYVDIADLIQDATSELEFNEQTIARIEIKEIIKGLEKSGDITYHKQQLSELTTSNGEQYFNKPVTIKTTMKRQEDKKKQKATYSANFHAPFTGNFNQGDTSNQSQSFNEESTESKELTKKTLEDFPKMEWYRRKNFIWLIVGVVLTAIAIIVALK